MTPLFDFGPLLHSLSATLLVIPAVLSLIVLRAVLQWRTDRREDEFAERCRRIDVTPKWTGRRAA